MFLKARGRCSVRFGCKVVVLQSKRGWILTPPTALGPIQAGPKRTPSGLHLWVSVHTVPLLECPCLSSLFAVLACSSMPLRLASLRKGLPILPNPPDPSCPKLQKAPNSPGTSGGAVLWGHSTEDFHTLYLPGSPSLVSSTLWLAP